MKRYYFVFAACLALTLAGCSGKKSGDGESKYVKTALAKRISDDAELTYSGKTKSGEEANVAFKVSGQLLKVYVKEGDYVKKGQVIAQMDDRDYQVQLSAVKAEYAQVKADAERVEALYKEQATTAANYDKARYGLKQMQEKLANAKNQVADTRLTATMSGYVQKKYHEGGETVSAGMPIVSLFTAGDIEVEIQVPASDYARRDALTEATCQFDIIPGETYPLKLERYSKEANSSGLYTARFKLQGNYDKNAVTPGMSVTVHLAYFIENLTDGVTVPSTAVLSKDGKTYVFVIDSEKGVANMREVHVGKVDLKGNIQVVSGLKPNEKVASAGVRFLTDGQQVEEVQGTSDANVGGLL